MPFCIISKYLVQPDKKKQSQHSRFTQEFEVIQDIGKGSFGEVYHCRNRLDGCMYAVKILMKKIVSEGRKYFFYLIGNKIGEISFVKFSRFPT